MTNWPDVAKDLIEAFVTLGIILAIFTDFWSSIAERCSSVTGPDPNPKLSTARDKVDERIRVLSSSKRAGSALAIAELTLIKQVLRG
jgi:hypothetical protein